MQCEKCGAEFDEWDTAHVHSRGLLTVMMACPGCGQLYRSDHLSTALQMISIPVILLGLYLLLPVDGGILSLLEKREALASIAGGLLGAVLGFLRRRMIAVGRS